MTSKASSRPTATQSSSSNRRRRHRNAGRFLVILHSLILGFSLISFGIFTAIIPIWNANFFHGTGAIRGDWPDGLPLIPLFVTIVVSAHYLIRLAIAKRNTTASEDYLKSRHSSQEPLRLAKIKLYVTLTSLVLLLTFLILSGISGLFRLSRPAVVTSSVDLSASTTFSISSVRKVIRSITDSNPTSLSLTPLAGSPTTPNSNDSSNFCTLANVFTRRCNPTLHLLGDLQITGIATGSLVWLFNFLNLILQARDYQHQKRRHQRSLRAKAKAKFDLVEDEMSRAEKGGLSPKKKIHHDRKRAGDRSASDMSLSTTEISRVTRPVHAHVAPNARTIGVQDVVRPKQHYYNPEITPSRSRSIRQAAASSNETFDSNTRHMQTPTAKPREISPVQYQAPTAYSRAVDEARKKVKPAETMRDWLATRY